MGSVKNLDQEADVSIEHAEIASSHAPPAYEIPRVTWWKLHGLRKLYAMMPLLFLGKWSLAKHEKYELTFCP